HAHPLNRERAARGLPALNGVWIWGEGQLPDIEHGEVTVHARSLPLRGAGELLGMARAHAALDEMLPAEGHSIIEYDDCVRAIDADDVEAWRAAVARIDADVLRPVRAWLDAHRKASAVLYAGDGKARVLQSASLLARLRGRLRDAQMPALEEE